MTAWLAALKSAIRGGGRAAIVTVASASGSTPREAGATMVVTSAAIDGTIGGGRLEHEATRLAREALENREMAAALWLVRFPLAARLGQCCGGVATLALATVDADALGWIEAAEACSRAASPFAVVSRVGSGPPAARRIVVSADHALGSLGDSGLDSAAVAVARARLGVTPSRGGNRTGLCETEGSTLLVHVVDPGAFDVLVFGNGHVGRALVQVLGALPARVRWIDAREEDFPPHLPANVEVVATDAPEREVAAAPRGAFVVVMTHSHALDFDIVEAALPRDDWLYLGLIGSKAKRAQFERRLAARGAPPQALARVTCPIGTGTLRSKEPGAIAVSVAAEMLAIREADAARHPAARSTLAR